MEAPPIENHPSWIVGPMFGWRGSNRIDTLEERDTVYRSEEDKKNYLYQKFRDLFTPDQSASSSFGDWSSLFSTKHVNPIKLAHATRPFQADEIKLAVFQLGSDMAPGPDG